MDKARQRAVGNANLHQMTRPPLKSELHHWWPTGLQEHWCDANGNVHVVRSNGDVIPSKPGNFGAITNAHHMKLGGPWDSTFEPSFNQPDGEIHDFLAWLSTLEASTVHPHGPMLPRILAQPLPDERQKQLARTVASLLARSPRTRNSIRSTTEYFRKQVSLGNPEVEKPLIALNQRGLYDAYRLAMETAGRWAILMSDSVEFIFGDGFLHNFPASTDGICGNRWCVLPITPTMTIAFINPTSHPADPKLVTLRLDNQETASLNQVIQGYSKEFLFFRSQRPNITEAFASGEFCQYRWHREEWLDELLDELAQYNLWGHGGTPSRCTPKRPDLDLEVWLDQVSRQSL